MTGHNRLINRYGANFDSLQVVQKKMSREFRILLLATLLHIPLGLLFYKSARLGVVSAIAAFSVGMYFALNKHYKIEYVAYVVVYIVGAEVLWRMASVPVFWEFGKYATVAVMTAALVRRGLYKIPTLPLVYFALLLPSVILTFSYFDLPEARDTLSFNLSGPLCLFVSCWFFSYIKLNQIQLRRLFLVLLVPAITVACAALIFTVTAEEIVFNTESNAATSGGFGPNQVSSLLGLGVFAAAACYVLFKNNSKYKLYLAGSIILLASQSIMTFSRGGIYNAIGGITVLALFQS